MVDSIRLSFSAAKPPKDSNAAYRMVIKTADGKHSFNALIAPVEITYANFGQVWTEVPRDGKMPYLLREAYKLPKITVKMQLVKEADPDWDATGALKVLTTMSNSGVPLKISYGGYFESSFLWRMTDYSFTSKRRRPSTNVITWAEVDMEFTVVNDVVLSTGPLNGGVSHSSYSGGSSSNSHSVSKPPGSKVGTRKYKFKKGDTLNSLALKFYKDVKYWRYLGDINHIKDVKKIKVGQVIKY